MTVFYPGTPPTRILSWSQMVREADPNFTRESLQPWVYQYSNSRRFLDTLPTYTPFAVTSIADNTGDPLLDDEGNWLLGYVV